jgi:hypothetical protein
MEQAAQIWQRERMTLGPLASSRKLWWFDPARLEPGDVVLESSAGLRAKGIRVVDGGDFSHALMWIGGTDFIEAVGGGARVISFARIIVRDPKRWMVLRFTGDQSAGIRAAQEARRIAHKGYDFKGAINTKLKRRKKADHTRLFCSQLVAEAYLRAGVSLVDGFNADMVTPGALQKLSHLVKIDTPLMEISPERHQDIEAFIDRDKAYEQTHMAKEMVTAQEAFATVRKSIGLLSVPANSSVRFPPGNLAELLDVLQVAEGAEADKISDALLSELQRLGYFDFLREPLFYLRIKVEGDVHRFRAGELSKIDIKEFVTWKTLSRYQETRDRYRNNFQVCQSTFARTNRKLFLRLASMYFINADVIDYIMKLMDEIEM